MPLAEEAICEFEEVLTERMNPSRAEAQFRLSEVCLRLPIMRERSSDAIPMSLSVQVLEPPPLIPTLAPATPLVTPASAPASPPMNQAVVISSAALRESPNCRCRLVEA